MSDDRPYGCHRSSQHRCAAFRPCFGRVSAVGSLEVVAPAPRTRSVERFYTRSMLLDLAIILVAAKLAAELCERVNVPAVVGEIVVGILIGPSVLGWIPADSEPIIALAELGVLLLLVQVGMEMDLAELGRVGRASMTVAVIGVAVPFVLGGGVALGFGETGNTALFIGAALTATSVGITARVFGDLRALATTEARVVLGAAVADDVLGLLILTVVVKIVTGDNVDALSI